MTIDHEAWRQCKEEANTFYFRGARDLVDDFQCDIDGLQQISESIERLQEFFNGDASTLNEKDIALLNEVASKFAQDEDLYRTFDETLQNDGSERADTLLDWDFSKEYVANEKKDPRYMGIDIYRYIIFTGISSITNPNTMEETDSHLAIHNNLRGINQHVVEVLERAKENKQRDMNRCSLNNVPYRPKDYIKGLDKAQILKCVLRNLFDQCTKDGLSLIKYRKRTAKEASSNNH
jgi:hypothetical protein